MRFSRILGWDVLSFLLIILGVLSTTLNILQVLNGIFCFDRIPSVNGLSNVFSSISASFEQSPIQGMKFCDNVTSDGYHVKLFTIRSGGYMSVKIRFDCNQTIDTDNVLHVNPSNVFVMPSGNISSGYKGSVLADSGFCVLQSRTYQWFAIFSIMFFCLLFFLRVLIRTVFFEHTARLFFSKHTQWIYLLLEKLEMFKNCNPYQSYPLKLNAVDELYEFSSEPGLDCIDTSGFTHHDACSNYTFSYENGSLSISAIDKSGLFSICESSNDLIAAKVRLCLLFRSQKKPIICSNHFLTVEECYHEILAGKNIIRSKNKPDYLFGVRITEIKYDKELMSKLKNHMQRFFGYYSYELLFQALESHYYDSSLPIKSSEWKLYLSDLYFHFKLKMNSKSKRYNPSKSFLSDEPVDLNENIEIGLLMNDQVQKKNILRRDEPADDESTTMSVRTNENRVNSIINFPAEDSQTANNDRLKIILTSRGSEDLNKKFVSAMRDFHEYFYESSHLTEKKIDRSIFVNNGQSERFMHYRGMINTRNWVAANDPEYLEIDQYYSWYCRKPNFRIVAANEFDEIKPIIDEYKSKLDELSKLMSEIASVSRHIDLASVVKKGKEAEIALEEYQEEYLNPPSKNKKKKAEQNIIKQRQLIESIKEELKSNPELTMVKNYRRMLAIANEAVNTEAHRNCVRYYTGCSNDCYFDYICENEKGSLVVNPSAIEQNANKIKSKLKKVLKGKMKNLMDPIVGSIKNMMLSGKRSSINRFVFDHEDHKHFLPPKVRKSLKMQYKNAVNDCKIFKFENRKTETERDFWIKYAEMLHCFHLSQKIKRLDGVLYKKIGRGTHPPMLSTIKLQYDWYLERKDMVESVERIFQL